MLGGLVGIPDDLGPPQLEGGLMSDWWDEDLCLRPPYQPFTFVRRLTHNDSVITDMHAARAVSKLPCFGLGAFFRGLTLRHSSLF